MHRIECKTHSVWAFSELNEVFHEKCEVLDFLREHVGGKQYGSAVKGLTGLFKRYATGGRQALTAEMLHEVDKPDKIWQFCKGDLRVLCFFDGGDVLLTNGLIKKTQKVDQAAVARAVSMKTKYFSTKGAPT